jgi:cell division septation protein DedD
MENFDPKPKGIKEKNLYILHLDTPRIIIIGSVIIGIITAAFLFGMSFMKDGKSASKEFAVSGMNFNDDKAAEALKSEIPPVPAEGVDDAALEEKISGGEDPKNPAVSKDTPKKNELASAKDNIKHDKGDILTNDNIKEIIPPAGKHKSQAKTDKIAKSDKKKENHKPIASKENKSNTQKHDNTSGKSKIYEVSRDINEKKPFNSYAVQVASYDTLSKAEHEKSLLKSKRYDAYIDKSLVNGKNYFRVRIGPVASSKKAYELLAEIQKDSRYTGSYMIKE